MWSTNVISLNQIDTDNLTFEGLRKKYGTPPNSFQRMSL